MDVIISGLAQQHPALAVVLTTAIVLASAVLAQALSRRVGLPAILFMLTFGIVLGPEVLGVIRPAIYGEGLRAVLSIAVAVIVF
jgi:NhaP-type Na+/H+ or K+/H+ antiporter